jgi:hypothetical protein
MVLINVELSLPEDLAAEAENAGLLTSDAIEALLRAEIRRRRVEQLFTTMDELASLEIPPLTPLEIEAEIKAVREAKGIYRASGS